MHTPEQAKALWCPMTRMAHITGHGIGEGALAGATYNRTSHAKCLSDKCAMWRWSTAATGKYITETDEEFQKRRRGYCGLAPIHSTT